MEVADQFRPLEAFSRLDRLGRDLADRERLGHIRIDVRRRAAVLLDVVGDHGFGEAVARAAVPGVRDHHAVSVARPYRRHESGALVGGAVATKASGL